MGRNCFAGIFRLFKRQKRPRLTLDELPEKVLLRVFLLLDPADLTRCEQICKKFLECVRNAPQKEFRKVDYNYISFNPSPGDSVSMCGQPSSGSATKVDVIPIADFPIYVRFVATQNLIFIDLQGQMLDALLHKLNVGMAIENANVHFLRCDFSATELEPLSKFLELVFTDADPGFTFRMMYCIPSPKWDGKLGKLVRPAHSLEIRDMEGVPAACVEQILLSCPSKTMILNASLGLTPKLLVKMFSRWFANPCRKFLYAKIFCESEQVAQGFALSTREGIISSLTRFPMTTKSIGNKIHLKQGTLLYQPDLGDGEANIQFLPTESEEFSLMLEFQVVF